MQKILKLIGSVLLIFSLEKLDVFQEHLGNMLELPAKSVIGQTFVAKHNNLSMINLLDCDDPELSNQDNLVFHLRGLSGEKLDDGEEVTTLNFSGANIGHHGILRLKFPPIPNSANRKFYFYIENMGGTPTASPSAKVLEIGYAKKDFYKNGSLVYNGREIGGDLAFRAFYSLYPHQFIVESLRDFLVRFWQDKSFFFFYMILISFLIYLIQKI